MSDVEKRLKDRIHQMILKGEEVVGSAYWPDLGHPRYGQRLGLIVKDDRFAEWRNQTLRLLESSFGRGDRYAVEFERATPDSTAGSTNAGLGILVAVQADLNDGFLSSVVELAHADVFTDFLDMAEHLMAENRQYKDAAAVLAGGVLEGHLRQLCQKHGVATEFKNRGGDSEPKKASRLNDELAGAGHISKIDQKAVTAWLAIRSSAAHGKYDEYSKEQVALMIMEIRGFIGRYPA